jgi:hypothetical protein
LHRDIWRAHVQRSAPYRFALFDVLITRDLADAAITCSPRRVGRHDDDRLGSRAPCNGDIHPATSFGVLSGHSSITVTTITMLGGVEKYSTIFA